MELIQIGENALKVTLTREDMEYYAIEFAQLDYANTETRRAIWSILDEAKRTLGFEAARDRLYIQAFKDADGGCELFVRRDYTVEKIKEKKVLYRFAELRALLCACARLCGCGFQGDSTAFTGDDGRLYLTLPPAEAGRNPYWFLSELGCPLPYDDAFLAEHASLLCENAVFELAALK